VIAYEPSEWTDFFVAAAGASAALLGLLFVAISINLERILKFPGLPGRALEAMMQLTCVLLVSLAGLVPGQGHLALGLELLVIVAAILAIVVRQPILVADETGREPTSWKVTRWTVRLAGLAVVGIGGISIAAESGGGLYWVAAGVALAIVAAIAGAWVLMVEILR
jgi:hypothetical protein